MAPFRRRDAWCTRPLEAVYPIVYFDVMQVRVRKRRPDARFEATGRIPAKEVVVLHDPDAEKSLVVLIIDGEEHCRQGDEPVNAMPVGDTLGRRVDVAKCDVAIRMST